MTDEEKVWFVHRTGRDLVGPVSASMLRRGLAAGKIPEDSIVARNGDSEWISVTAFSAESQLDDGPSPEARPEGGPSPFMTGVHPAVQLDYSQLPGGAMPVNRSQAEDTGPPGVVPVRGQRLGRQPRSWVLLGATTGSLALAASLVGGFVLHRSATAERDQRIAALESALQQARSDGQAAAAELSTTRGQLEQMRSEIRLAAEAKAAREQAERDSSLCANSPRFMTQLRDAEREMQRSVANARAAEFRPGAVLKMFAEAGARARALSKAADEASRHPAKPDEADVQRAMVGMLNAFAEANKLFQEDGRSAIHSDGGAEGFNAVILGFEATMQKLGPQLRSQIGLIEASCKLTLSMREQNQP